MTTLREAATRALEAWDQPHGINYVDFRPYMDALRAALAEPEPPPEAQTQAEKVAYCAGWWDALAKARGTALAEPQEPYTGDVTRIIREAGMTFHLGLPHKPVIEQMSRVIDLVYAEASIKAAQQFAASPQRKPLTEEEISSLWDSHIVPVFGKNGINPIVFARAIEQAHGIGSKT